MHVTLGARELPVLHECDVAVAGGSLGGVAAALAQAQAGRRVALIESRTYLGREITATLRPWLPADGERPPLIASLIEAAGGAPVDGEVPLRMDAVKVRLEDELLGAGVRLLYTSRPVAVCRRGLVIANKSGRQLIACRAVVDATATALVCRLAGVEFAAGAGEETYARTVEFEGVGPIEGRDLAVPAGLGLVGDSVRVHRGYRGEGHVLLEHRMRLPAPDGDAWSLTRVEAEARRRTQALVTYLYAEEPAFAEPSPGAGSYELHGPGAPRVVGPLPAWLRRVSAEAVREGSAIDVDLDAGIDAPEAGTLALPVAREADVLVVGGGSSGSVASIAAARQGHADGRRRREPRPRRHGHLRRHRPLLVPAPVSATSANSTTASAPCTTACACAARTASCRAAT